jgi:hypothetical protein
MVQVSFGAVEKLDLVEPLTRADEQDTRSRLLDLQGILWILAGGQLGRRIHESRSRKFFAWDERL